VIAPDETGRPQFYDLLRRTRGPAYVGFALLWLNGADLSTLPLRERRRRRQAILPAGSPTISEAVSVEGRGRELFELMCVRDLEGIVGKRLADFLRPTRQMAQNQEPWLHTQSEGRGDLFSTPPRARK